jgi:hypothetical protein
VGICGGKIRRCCVLIGLRHFLLPAQINGTQTENELSPFLRGDAPKTNRPDHNSLRVSTAIVIRNPNRRCGPSALAGFSLTAFSQLETSVRDNCCRVFNSNPSLTDFEVAGLLPSQPETSVRDCAVLFYTCLRKSLADASGNDYSLFFRTVDLPQS